MVPFTPTLPDTKTASSLEMWGAFMDAKHLTRVVGDRLVKTFQEVKTKARQVLEEQIAQGFNATGYVSLVLLGNDDIALVRINRNGSTRFLWNYTKGCKGKGQ